MTVAQIWTIVLISIALFLIFTSLIIAINCSKYYDVKSEEYLELVNYLTEKDPEFGTLSGCSQYQLIKKCLGLMKYTPVVIAVILIIISLILMNQ